MRSVLLLFIVGIPTAWEIQAVSGTVIVLRLLARFKQPQNHDGPPDPTWTPIPPLTQGLIVIPTGTTFITSLDSAVQFNMAMCITAAVTHKKAVLHCSSQPLTLSLVPLPSLDYYYIIFKIIFILCVSSYSLRLHVFCLDYVFCLFFAHHFLSSCWLWLLVHYVCNLITTSTPRRKYHCHNTELLVYFVNKKKEIESVCSTLFCACVPIYIFCDEGRRTLLHTVVFRYWIAAAPSGPRLLYPSCSGCRGRIINNAARKGFCYLIVALELWRINSWKVVVSYVESVWGQFSGNFAAETRADLWRA